LKIPVDVKENASIGTMNIVIKIWVLELFLHFPIIYELCLR